MIDLPPKFLFENIKYQLAEFWED